jgi:hypothetical protein
MGPDRPCARKKRYPDRIAAELALVSTRRNDQRRPKNERRTYKCGFCLGWHLTSQRKRTRKNTRTRRAARPALLRQAAAHIRDTVARLPEGHRTTWKATTLEPGEHHPDYAWCVQTDPDRDPRIDPTTDTRTFVTLAECGWARADADHMAQWDPPTALDVADHLAAVAEALVWLSPRRRDDPGYALVATAERTARAVLAKQVADDDQN